MDTALRSMAEVSPGRILFLSWALLLLCQVIGGVPYLKGPAAAAAFTTFVAYPYIVASGMPAQWVRPRVKNWARLLFRSCFPTMLLLALWTPMASAIESKVPAGRIAATVLMVLVGWVCVVTFAPFFLATIAIRDAQRSKDRRFFLGSAVPLFCSLYFGLFGGLIYCHPKIQELLDAS